MKTGMKEYWSDVFVTPIKTMARHPFITVLYTVVCVLIGLTPIYGPDCVKKLKDKFSKKKEETP